MFFPDTMSLLDILPPSPPTTTSRNATANGPRLFIAPPTIMSTPEDSPASMPGSSNQGSRRKVEFCAQPNIYDAAVFASSPEQAASVKPLPPSREHRPNRRSILKPSSQTEVRFQSKTGQQEDKLSVNENMDSIVQQLSKNDKPTSLDAYNTLASLFRAYDDLPEAIVLKNKLSTLIRYIRRDLASQDKADEEPTDTNLILSALKLLIILVWNSAYSPLLSDEAKTFILDRSIHVISEHRASKNVIAHYLHLLSTQNFRPQMLAANNRAGRLLDALKELPDHITSSAVVSETIMVLGRLTDQARPVMRAKADCWVEILLRTMTTPSRDTREKAISFGMKACSAFATAPSVSAAFRDMLKRETDTNTTLEANACKRLKAMFDKPEDAVLVPQVWATILLLAVNTTNNVNEWTSLRSCWLEVIQTCFNSSDTTVRIHANFAWNRLVSLARPHQASDALASLLGKPVAGQMERSGRDKQAHDSRMSALSSYCNLLYYAFRPAATHQQYTRSWNEYIVKILRSNFFGRNPSNSDFACRVFMALTWNSTRVTKVWKDTRAHDNTTVKPEELPTIDAKWLRKNCGTVLQMFKLLFTYSTWVSSPTSDQIYIAGAWKHFAKSLGDAASKEIKASSETIQACAQVVRLVQELWRGGPRTVHASDGDFRTLTERLGFLLRVVIAELGAAPFIDVIDDGTVCLPPALLQTFASTAVEMRHGFKGADSQLGGAYLAPKPGAPSLLLLEKTLYLLDKRFQDAYQASDLDQRDMDSALELLSVCLRDVPENVRILTLQTMQPSLQSWLEDPNRSSTMGQVLEIARIDTAKRFANTVIPSLASLPHSTIESLDGLFAAGFRSTHKDTINQMVNMWNMTHGQALRMVYGPSLTTALTRLRPYVDIELVDFRLPDGLHLPETCESTAPPAFLDFIETQSQLAAVEIDEKGEEIRGRPQSQVRRNGDLIPQEAPKAIPSARHIETTTTSRPQSNHSTPQRSRRHNDSQVRFQSIDSSPLNPMQAESQYLTERQKEVRDKRQDASVYFPDLKPEIAPKLVHNIIPTSELGRRALIEEQRPSTPTLPGRGLADFDNNPTASPTPRSKHQALRLDDMEAPSSPLSVQADEDVIVQAVMGKEGSKEGAAEDDHKKLAEEDIAIEDDPTTMLTELQQDSPKYRGTVNGDAEDMRPHNLVLLLNEVVQTTNSVFEDVPKATLSEREHCAEADSATHKEAEIVLSSERGQLELSNPYNSHPASSPNGIDSDELDFMSQSQLSQDLESHISEHGDTPESVLAVEATEPDQTVTSFSAATASQKRKRSSSLYSGLKRRKSRSFSCSLSNVSQEDGVGVTSDCIEVDTSSRMLLTESWALERQSPAKATSQRVSSDVKSGFNICPASVDADVDDPSTDAHGMPSPVLYASGSSPCRYGLSEDQKKSFQATPEPSFNSLTPVGKQAGSVVEAGTAVADVVETTAGRTQLMVVTSEAPRGVTKNVGAVILSTASRSTATGTGELAVQTQDVAVQTMSAPHQHVSVQVETDIMTSLEDVLERLKQCNGEGLDLRSLDDLCFQIRTEGQNASSRWASN